MESLIGGTVAGQGLEYMYDSQGNGGYIELPAPGQGLVQAMMQYRGPMGVDQRQVLFNQLYGPPVQPASSVVHPPAWHPAQSWRRAS
jgi:hypothetical protein